MKLRAWVVAIGLGLLAGRSVVRAEAKLEGAEASCDKPTAWNDLNLVELKMTSSGQPGYATWRMVLDQETTDIQVDSEMSDGTKTEKGRILVVGGRVMAMQGPSVEPGYEIDLLDAPILEWQLVTRLLGRALPDGPPKVPGVRQIDFAEEHTGIKLATPSAGGTVPAPWRVVGDVKTLAPDAVEFHLQLTVRQKAAPADESSAFDQVFVGRLSKIANAKIDGALSLEGWSVFGLGAQTRTTAEGTIVDYGAGPASSAYKSVADIRTSIVADNFPGEPDPSRDFTGFWKHDCEEPFGLQVMHFGADGKYSIVFCGPGGCGKAGEDGRNTFITKDPHYEVVAENEIRIRGNDGAWETYRRCTKDTHPILEYKKR